WCGSRSEWCYPVFGRLGEGGFDLREDGLEHRRRQLAGVGVVARAMKAVEQGRVRELGRGAVAEGELRRLLIEGAHRRFMRDAAEGDDRRHLLHAFEGRGEED